MFERCFKSVRGVFEERLKSVEAAAKLTKGGLGGGPPPEIQDTIRKKLNIPFSLMTHPSRGDGVEERCKQLYV